MEEPISFSWPTLARDSYSVIGEAQLERHSCLLPVRQPEKPDKAQRAMLGLDSGGLSKKQLATAARQATPWPDLLQLPEDLDCSF